MIELRKANEDDLPQVLGIYNEIIANTTAVFQYDLQTIEMRKEWFATKKSEGFPVFVVCADLEVVGFSSIGAFRNWQAYKFSVENSVYVKREWRGKGIGKLLLGATVAAAREMGMHT